jgi:type I restriction enzyme, S subunit
MNWDDLPSSWMEAAIGEICGRVVDGSHNPPKAVLEGFPMLSARNIQNRAINFNDFRYISVNDFKIENNRTNISAGDVLLTIVGTIGRTAIVPDNFQPFVLQRSVAVLKFPIINNKFLSFCLESPLLQTYFEKNAKGTAQKGIYLKVLSEIVIPLPPLLEQKRIADKLERVLSRVDAARQRLERVPTLLKRFRASVLEQAVSGELTREWRGGEQENIKYTLSKISGLDVGYAFKSVDFTDGGIKLLRGDNIEPSRLRWIDARCMPLEKLDDFQKYFISEGDVILAMDRPIISSGLKIAIATKKDVPCVLVQRVCRFVPSNLLSANYLYVCLRSNRFIDYLEEEQNGTQVPHISAKQILGFEIPLPPLLEQTEIIRRVEHLFKLADQLEGRYLAAKTHLERLTPALLAKAFRGELVEQDPTDEPASVLLERIRAERTAVPAKKSVSGPKPRAVKTTETNTTETSKKRGRPAKTAETSPQTSPPQAMLREIPLVHDFEAAVKLLETRKLEREAVGTVQGSLFDLDQK